MSIENLQAFGRLIASDDKVKEAVKAIGATNVEGLIAYAAERGLPFDLDDMRALARRTGEGQDELNEAQLQSVAGGISTTTSLAVLAGQTVSGNWIAAGETVLAGHVAVGVAAHGRAD